MVRLCVQFSDEYDVPDWRQYQYNLRKLKKYYRRLQKMKQSTSKDAAKKAAKAGTIEEACQEYLDYAQMLLQRAWQTVS